MYLLAYILFAFTKRPTINDHRSIGTICHKNRLIYDECYRYYMQNLLRSSRNAYKCELYASSMLYECSNPYCTSGIDPEVHHITPLNEGGEDKYYNYIVLCHYCHRHSGIHKHYVFAEPILYDWKFRQEMEKLGFTLSDKSDNYHANVGKLVDGKIDTATRRRGTDRSEEEIDEDFD